MKNTTFGIAKYKACHADFIQSIRLLAAQFEHNKQIIRISFFGNATNVNYEEKLISIRQALSSIFDKNIPLFSFIAQPTQNTDEVLAEVIYMRDDCCMGKINHQVFSGIPYIVIENEQSKTLFIEGVRSTDFSESIINQGNEIFEKIGSIFEKEGFKIHDIIRQWNYIGKITASTCDVQHYQAFNEARAQFYAKANWQNQGYPAATGIGISIQGLLISMIAFSPKTADIRIIPIDNPLQVAAHHYSQSKLIAKKRLDQHATPKFERAKIIIDKAGGLCFISGTAAIRGEESMHSMKAEIQTRQTIENINFLISDTNLQHYGITGIAATIISLRVYYKEEDDINSIKSEVKKHWFDIPIVYTQADICRKELLVEIEGIATLTH